MRLRKRVLLDVDGVVADLVSPTVDFLHSWSSGFDGRRPTADDIHSWDIAASVAAHNGAYYAFVANKLQALFNSEGFVAGLPAYPDAIETVSRLSAVADIYFVTAGRDQSRYWHYERFQWLTKNFGGLFQDVIFANHKHLVEGDFFLDDKPANVIARGRGHNYLMRRPWNKSDKNCFAVSSLAQFAEIVEASC